MRARPGQFTVCTAEGCERPYVAAGWCNMHYQRMRNYGSLDDPTPTPEERFWSKVTKSDPDECWQWVGVKDGHGYGAFVMQRKQYSAHRLSFQWAGGVIPSGLMLDHICHNRDAECPGGKACLHRACVNPAHLEPVTNQQNQLRAVARFALA